MKTTVQATEGAQPKGRWHARPKQQPKQQPAQETVELYNRVFSSLGFAQLLDYLAE